MIIRRLKPFQYLTFFAALMTWGSLLHATTPRANIREAIAGDALLNEGGYHLLAELSDRYGPRMIGTDAHAASLDMLESKLQALGIETRRQTFEFPGWIRGEAHIELLEPNQRDIRAAALGYVGPASGVEGKVAYVDQKKIEDMNPDAIRSRILLVKQHLTYTPDQLKTLAEDYDVRGAMLINRVNGGQLLARIANHDGIPTPFPMFTITQEEGTWLKRKLEEGQTVRVRLETTSKNKTMTASNLIATFPGLSKEKVILGGHFDSWDLGQGAMDNGLGVAQIFEVARLLQTHSPTSNHTVELIWFDAEEFGLWGSRHYTKVKDLSDVRAMVNLDMVGEPLAVNAMGFDGLKPRLETFAESIGGWSFDQKVANKTWMGSDHHPFILKGVPAVTFNAPIDADDVRYYHDFADTFDKVDRQTLARASAIIALLIYDLAGEADAKVPHLSEEERAKLFRDAGLEDRMRRADAWPFGDAKPDAEGEDTKE